MVDQSPLGTIFNRQRQAHAPQSKGKDYSRHLAFDSKVTDKQRTTISQIPRVAPHEDARATIHPDALSYQQQFTQSSRAQAYKGPQFEFTTKKTSTDQIVQRLGDYSQHIQGILKEHRDSDGATSIQGLIDIQRMKTQEEMSRLRAAKFWKVNNEGEDIQGYIDQRIQFYYWNRRNEANRGDMIDEVYLTAQNDLAEQLVQFRAAPEKIQTMRKEIVESRASLLYDIKKELEEMLSAFQERKDATSQALKLEEAVETLRVIQEVGTIDEAMFKNLEYCLDSVLGKSTTDPNRGEVLKIARAFVGRGGESSHINLEAQLDHEQEQLILESFKSLFFQLRAEVGIFGNAMIGQSYDDVKKIQLADMYMMFITEIVPRIPIVSYQAADAEGEIQVYLTHQGKSYEVRSIFKGDHNDILLFKAISDQYQDILAEYKDGLKVLLSQYIRTLNEEIASFFQSPSEDIGHMIQEKLFYLKRLRDGYGLVFEIAELEDLPELHISVELTEDPQDAIHYLLSSLARDIQACIVSGDLVKLATLGKGYKEISRGLTDNNYDYMQNFGRLNGKIKNAIDLRIEVLLNKLNSEENIQMSLIVQYLVNEYEGLRQQIGINLEIPIPSRSEFLQRCIDHMFSVRGFPRENPLMRKELLAIISTYPYRDGEFNREDVKVLRHLHQLFFRLKSSDDFVDLSSLPEHRLKPEHVQAIGSLLRCYPNITDIDFGQLELNHADLKRLMSFQINPLAKFYSAKKDIPDFDQFNTTAKALYIKEGVSANFIYEMVELAQKKGKPEAAVYWLKLMHDDPRYLSSAIKVTQMPSFETSEKAMVKEMMSGFCHQINESPMGLSFHDYSLLFMTIGADVQFLSKITEEQFRQIFRAYLMSANLNGYFKIVSNIVQFSRVIKLLMLGPYKDYVIDELTNEPAIGSELGQDPLMQDLTSTLCTKISEAFQANNFPSDPLAFFCKMNILMNNPPLQDNGFMRGFVHYCREYLLSDLEMNQNLSRYVRLIQSTGTVIPDDLAQEIATFVSALPVARYNTAKAALNQLNRLLPVDKRYKDPTALRLGRQKTLAQFVGAHDTVQYQTVRFDQTVPLSLHNASEAFKDIYKYFNKKYEDSKASSRSFEQESGNLIKQMRKLDIIMSILAQAQEPHRNLKQIFANAMLQVEADTSAGVAFFVVFGKKVQFREGLAKLHDLLSEKPADWSGLKTFYTEMKKFYDGFIERMIKTYLATSQPSEDDQKYLHSFLLKLLACQRSDSDPQGQQVRDLLSSNLPGEQQGPALHLLFQHLTANAEHLNHVSDQSLHHLEWTIRSVIPSLSRPGAPTSAAQATFRERVQPRQS